MTDPLPEPEAGLTVNQVAFEETLQVVLAVTDSAVDPAEADGTDQLDKSKVNDGATAAGCVTVIVRVTCGVPDVVTTVSVALRADVVVLACADKVMEALPEPEAGLRANHEAFEAADQATFEVTDTEVESAEADGTDQLDRLKVNDGVTAAPGCVTDTVRVTGGVPDVVVTVTVAVRADVAVLACADNVTEPLFEPAAGLTVNQVASDEADQVVLEVTDSEVDPVEADGTDQVDRLSVNDGVTAAPGWVTDTVRVTCGEPVVVVSVTVAVRDDVAVLA